MLDSRRVGALRGFAAAAAEAAVRAADVFACGRVAVVARVVAAGTRGPDAGVAVALVSVAVPERFAALARQRLASMAK